MKRTIQRIAALVVGLGLGFGALAGLETVTHISDLNSSWPLGSDLASTSDDHIRNIKVALKTDFPNVNAAVTPTPTQFNQLTTDTFTFVNVSGASLPANGIYLPTASTLGFSAGTSAVGSLTSTMLTMPAVSVTGTTIPANGIYTPVGNSLAFASATTQRASVSSVGAWTVQAPSSGNTLTVNAVSGSLSLLAVGATSTYGGIGLQDGNTGTRQYWMLDGGAAVGAYSIYDNTAGQHRFKIDTSGNISGWGIVAAANVDLTPDTSTFTATYTGFTAGVSCTATWSRVGKLVTLAFCTATGTSNASSFTMTGLPAAIQPASLTQTVALPIGPVQNASIIDTTVSVTVTAASGTVTFLHNGSAPGWTNSGTKGFGSIATISYLLN